MQITPTAIKTLSTSLLAVCAIGLSPSAAQAQEIKGRYNVSGTDIDGTKYKGSLSIEPSGSTFKLTYRDGKTQKGVGILRNGRFYSAWGPSDKCGVAVYFLKADGNLEGEYAYIGDTGVYKETTKRTGGSATSMVGSFDLAGRDSAGTPYAGKLAVQARGQLFKVDFKMTNEEHDGVAIQTGNALAVGWGGNKCSVASYAVKGDNTMSGSYAVYGETKQGTEEIAKAW